MGLLSFDVNMQTTNNCMMMGPTVSPYGNEDHYAPPQPAKGSMADANTTWLLPVI
jgi:hypothetical protein